MEKNGKNKLPVLTNKFEWSYLISSILLITGAYSDAWSHTHIPGLETFFTWSHTMLYLGGGLITLIIVLTSIINIKSGYKLNKSVPKGYFIAIIGVITFTVGGIGDLLWHELIGIENDLEAAFSATHLLIITGIFLLMIAPAFAAIANHKKQAITIPISLTLALLALSVITQWAHPIVQLYPTMITEVPDLGYSLGILALMMQTLFMMGILLPMVDKKFAPVGSMTAILTINAIYLAFMRYNFILIIPYLITGLIADFMYYRLIKRGECDLGFRVFSLIIPLVLYSLYFLFIDLFYELKWNAHIISGGIFFPVIISGFIGMIIKFPYSGK